MKNRILEWKYAAIVAAAGFLWVCLEFAVGLHTKYISLHPQLTMLALVPIIALISMGISAKKQALGADATAGKIFISGVLIGVFGIPFSLLGLYIFHTFVNPHFFADFTAYAVEHQLSTQAEAEAYFNLKNYMLQSAIGTALMTWIVASISTLVWWLRNK